MNHLTDIGTINTWEDVIGNKQIVSHLKNLLRALTNNKASISSVNILLTGESRSGKTSATRFFLRCFHCESLCSSTLNPMCNGNCKACKHINVRFGEAGVLARLYGVKRESLVRDCGRFSRAEEVRELVCNAEQLCMPSLIVLDEVSRLEKQVWSDYLLSSLETPGQFWLATAISAEKLDPPFKNRFSILKTEQASEDDLLDWTIRRMNRHGITLDNEKTLTANVRRFQTAPGRIVQALLLASISPNRMLIPEHFGTD